MGKSATQHPSATSSLCLKMNCTSGTRTMPPTLPPSYPNHPRSRLRCDADGYERHRSRSRYDADRYDRDRCIRQYHRSRSPIRYIIDEFELGDSYRAARGLVTASSSRFLPETSHPKISAPPPNVQQHHYEKSDKRKTTSQRLHESEDFPSKPMLAPSTNNPTPHNSGDQILPSWPSEIQVEKIAFDAVHDPSQSSKDISIQFHVPIEHDLSPYLDDFCRFRRLGRFKEAKVLYQSKLAQHGTIPFIFIHYAEMLVVSGDYKSFQELSFPCLNEEKNPKSATDGKLKTNFELLRLITRSPVWNYTITALQTVRGVLEDLKDEQVLGSTEIQLLSLCLQVLSYLKASSHSQVVAQAIHDAKALLNLELLYYRLLSEARIWDFRDLLVSTVLLFGWLETIAMLFKSKDSDGALARIHEDWAQLGSSEAVVLGLLDIFTSHMLQIRPLDQGAELLSPTLIEHARLFAESAQKDDAENMKTRPLIQWILAKTWWETRPTPKRPDGVTINDFQGLLLEQGDGIHLPVFVPNNHSERPDWTLISARPNTAQRSAVEVALGAAMERDDLYLQAMALKLLCLQSPDPTRPMNALATLQLDLQGDMEGFLGTCLARYLVPQGQNEADEKELLRNFKQLDNVSENSYLHSVMNPSFIWARDVIHSHIRANVTGKQTQTPDWAMHLRIYGPRLPQYVATFIKDHFRLNIPPPMRVSFNIIGIKNAQKDSANALRRLSDSPYKPHVHDREGWRHRPLSPFLGRMRKPIGPGPSTIRDGRDSDYDYYSSYDSSSGADIVCRNLPSRYWAERDRRHRAELERLRARAADLKTQVEMRKELNKETKSQRLDQQWLDVQETHEHYALAQERLERIGLAGKPEMPNLAQGRHHVERSKSSHGAAAGDQDAVNGENMKIPIGIEIDPRLLKDNTVTFLVQRRDDPEQMKSRQVDDTGLFCKQPGELDDNERAALAKDSRSDSTAQPPLVHRPSLPKRATVALSEKSGHDSEEARPSTGIEKETSTMTGKRNEHTTKHHKQHVTKSTLRTQNRSSSWASSADSQPKPAARKKKGASWPKSTANNSKEPSNAQPPLEPLSEKVIGELEAEARTKRRSTWDTRAERNSEPDLGEADPGEWDGPRVYDLDDLNNMTDPAPAPPPRRSTVEDADDEESWGRPVAEREPEMVITEIPDKGEEASSKGPAQPSGNLMGLAAGDSNDGDDREESFEDQVAKKMSERLAGANEYMDQVGSLDDL